MKERKLLKFVIKKLQLISEWNKVQRALESRREMGILDVAREHSISEKVSGMGMRPTDEMVGHEVGDCSFNDLIENNSVEELEEWKKEKEQKFGELIDQAALGESELSGDNRENLRIARREYERESEIPEEVKQVVEGENGLRQRWSDAEDFSDVEEEFIEMIDAFREYSGGDYGKVLEIWEPNISPEKVDHVIEEVRNEALAILRDLDLEQVEEVWSGVESSVDTDKTLGELSENPTGMHEFLANYILGGNPVKMPVRIGGSGMEYGNSVMAPLQTVDDRFWAKCFDTTAHEFGHTYGRENLSSEHAFLPLGEPPSEAIDEGTARFYQNQVFRSEEFLTDFFAPAIKRWFDSKGQENLDFDSRGLYRWFNAIDPDNRERISADPITYPLHVAVRYELEKELIESDEPVESVVKDLDNRWEEKMQRYLGDPLDREIAEMDDAETVLQDVHWGKGKFGYFPAYTLGDVMASKWRKDMEEELEQDFEHYLSNADSEPIDEWIVDNLWQYGKAVWDRSGHVDLDPEPYKQHMRRTAEIYDD